MGTGSFPGGKERPGSDPDPSPPSSAVGHERVELYLYSPVSRTACTEPQCLYKGAFYLYFLHSTTGMSHVKVTITYQIHRAIVGYTL